ncbi:helix-hairpin-helix domain-containing protein, partial [Streptomyces polyrhachis]
MSDAGALADSDPGTAGGADAAVPEERAAEPARGAVEAAGDAAAGAAQDSEAVEERAEPERVEPGAGAVAGKARAAVPVEAGQALSGDAAQLLAAVRAVEKGERPASSFYAQAPRPARRAPAPRTAPPPSGGSPVAGAVAPGEPDAAAVAAVREVLAAGGAPEALAARAVEVLGEGAADALRADPWQLLAVPGVMPAQADGFARALLGAGCGPEDPRRTLALAGWLLEQAARRGHTVLESAVLAKALAQYGVADADAALEAAVGEGAALVFHEPLGPPAAEGEEPPVRVLLGLERYALAEESLAEGVARLRTTFGEREDPADGGAAAWERVAEAAPGPSAAELVRAASQSGLVLHVGGEAARAEPAALVAAALRLGLRACLAAYTADGRRRAAALLAAAAPGAAVAGGRPGSGGAQGPSAGTVAGAGGP